jgi:hypothetical protein
MTAMLSDGQRERMLAMGNDAVKATEVIDVTPETGAENLPAISGGNGGAAPAVQMVRYGEGNWPAWVRPELEGIPPEAQAIVYRKKLLQKVMGTVLVKGTHYAPFSQVTGRRPAAGAPDPDILLKPGADAICSLFKFRPEYDVRKEDMGGGHYDYDVTCSLRDVDGEMLAQGVASCNTRESKYRNRPPADFYNTCKKMAAKRALVHAVLLATACSDIFVQDMEEEQHRAPANQAARQAEPARQVDAPARAQGEADRNRPVHLDYLGLCERLAPLLGVRTAEINPFVQYLAGAYKRKPLEILRPLLEGERAEANRGKFWLEYARHLEAQGSAVPPSAYPMEGLAMADGLPDGPLPEEAQVAAEAGQ